MFKFEKIDIVNLFIVIGLEIALIFSINNDLKELAMGISSGLIGFLGGVARGSSNTNSINNK